MTADEAVKALNQFRPSFPTDPSSVSKLWASAGDGEGITEAEVVKPEHDHLKSLRCRVRLATYTPGLPVPLRSGPSRPAGKL